MIAQEQGRAYPVLMPLVTVNPIIAKILAAGAAFSRDSRLQGACAHWGAPAKPDQKLTSGEFRKPHEIVIASCKSWGEMDYRVVINATVGLRNTVSIHVVRYCERGPDTSNSKSLMGIRLAAHGIHACSDTCTSLYRVGE